MAIQSLLALLIHAKKTIKKLMFPYRLTDFIMK